MPGVQLVKNYLGFLPSAGVRTIVSVGAVVFGMFGLFAAQLFGLAALASRRGMRLSEHQRWLLAVLCSGLLAALFVRSPGTGNELYCLAYGMMAGCTLSADGLSAWSNRPHLTPRTGFVLSLAIGLVILAAAMLIPEHFQNSADPSSVARTYIFSFSVLVGGLIAVALVASHAIRQARWAVVCVSAVAVIGAGLLDTPVESVEPGLHPSGPPEAGRRITPELFSAMTWIRDNTPADSVIAVKEQIWSIEFDYAVFSERRTFLGGWGSSLPSRESGYADVEKGLALGVAGSAGSELVAQRVKLNTQMFTAGNPSAVSKLEKKYGVRYLLVDQVNGFPVNSRKVARVAKLVYSAPGVEVLKLRSPR